MAKLIINESKKMGTIAPEIYGHFSEHLGRCIYEGLYVKEDSGIPNKNGMRTDVVEALKEMGIPVLRWPGGCFADEYHWKDGIGPKENRKKMINTHWGGVIEDNSFGTHEFFELCEQLGCKTYVNGNLGSGTVQEMSEWVEYITFDGVSPMADQRKANGHEKPWKLDYFAVGNENWGCGGDMTPEYYGNEYRRYQTYLRQFNKEHPFKKIACGANGGDTSWTKGVLSECSRNTLDRKLSYFMNGLSLHFYTGVGGSATQFDENIWYKTLNGTLVMEDMIRMHSAIMDQYDPDKEVGMMIDEWGTWYSVEPGTNPGFLYQQNTMRDALVAAINLNIFNKHCDRVKMACIAQTVNVLQAVALTEGEKMLLTPTYYVFHMYKKHQGAQLLESNLTGTCEIGSEEFKVPNLHESVSVQEDGTILVTIANLSVTDSYPVDVILTEKKPASAKGVILTNKMDAYNTFEEPETVKEAAFEDFTVTDRGLSFNIPACSVISFEIA